MQLAGSDAVPLSRHTWGKICWGQDMLGARHTQGKVFSQQGIPGARYFTAYNLMYLIYERALYMLSSYLLSNYFASENDFLYKMLSMKTYLQYLELVYVIMFPCNIITKSFCREVPHIRFT